MNFPLTQWKHHWAKKVKEFLHKEKEIEMNAIYQFELKELELIDVGSSEQASDDEE